MFDFKELQYVLAIVETGGFSSAARKLFLSQPSLSQYVRKLEEALGFEIFERTGQCVTLTYEGKEYVAYARETLKLREQFLQRVDDISTLKRGHVRIGVPFFRSSFFIPRLLPGFAQICPGITIELMEKPTPELERYIARGEVDLAFTNLPNYTQGISHERLFDEKLLLSIPAEHRLCRDLVHDGESRYPSFDLRKAAEEPFIMMPPHYRLRVIAEQICLDNGFSPRVILETMNYGTAEYLVSEGLGLTFSCETIATMLPLPRVIRATFINNDYIWPVAVLFSSHDKLSFAARAFLEYTKQQLGDRSCLSGL